MIKAKLSSKPDTIASDKLPRKVLAWRKALRGIMNALVDLRVEGLEHVPESEGSLVTTSHISRLDTPFLMFATPRNDTIGMVADEYQRFLPFRWILNGIKVIWVSRSEYDFSAFRESLAFLKNDWIVGIAPEGTRSRDGRLLEGKPGAALLARRAGVKIVPAIVSGSTEMFSRLLRLRKMRVLVRFGKAFSLPQQDEAEDNKAWLERATDEIMARIAILLPPERRGFYAQHPKVLQLLEAEP